MTRPPVAIERLKLGEDGKHVSYQMKRPWSDGTTEIILSGVELMEKLAAAVPPPRGHLIRYVGVLAPNSRLRKQIVLKPKPKTRTPDGKPIASLKQRISWADLAKRTFGVDLSQCIVCGGAVRRIAVIRDPAVALRILRHLESIGRSAHGKCKSRPPPPLVRAADKTAAAF